MSNVQISDISSLLTDSLLLNGYRGYTTSDALQSVKDSLQDLPSVLDKTTLDGLVDGKYDITLKEYTNFNTYNTMMNALYGNQSANRFQNVLNILTDSAEDKLANAKSFIDKMKENGMSNSSAVKTYVALQKYSMLESVNNNLGFVSARA